MGPIIRLKNCRVLRGRKFQHEDLFVQDGKIINYLRVFYEQKRKPDTVIDCKGHIIAPGFIDLQINGAFGYDFSHNNETVSHAVSEVARELLPSGVIGFCPTLVSSPPEVYQRVLKAIKKTQGGKDGSAVLGLHLEGPFIAMAKRGAHNPNHVRDLSGGITDLREVYGDDLSSVAIVTLAPELDPSGVAIQHLIRQGIIVSLGHSMASLEQGQTGARHGATLITHLFNAMLPFHHRDPGFLGLLSSSVHGQAVRFGLIADGIHTHPETLRLAHRTNPENLVLVTDAVAAMGLSSGTHFIGDMFVVTDGKRALIEGTETLCGCIGTMDACIRQFYASSGCSREEALIAASYHPAQVLGLQSKGLLEIGYDADFVILDDDLNVLSTWIAGEKVWEKQ
ncbi:N-acetylglucosamine-6-phosphate deacetylase-like [Varroa destructor]|uniref:N-acetylglucosamine-6-phosphate deacetylase n=1 Tax=Varroa destructor TaxID=109461 RepID=A0A7M7KQI2_VARDE|nr:N-acetylglucosamine-6-phosphate deacetylase-like [Varroa destructor]XP_022669312.1 N-acetylglucosamine-6-phosphate deacetylase-like [Varroa destructor]XP_022669313.1 N-acetylglucosamine-6-phosphate deacetylase-like [Varroa destructor]XP_022669315.1 N-acetylglucosamine-6-phosphate deacetylase-like [Varroa destructor]XP_022669316.1 N-acetylglucosamine-6-phosphate deacetylase-like [Varroa destructor]XP_022669317.1 N-acetylglucosamine-6-phosphate deacetylase-like [Varroa destructor]XP_02266931